MGRGFVTEIVVPQVVAGLGEKGSVVFTEHQAVLVLVIVRLVIGPVKPFNGLVHVGPQPLSLVVVGVVATLYTSMNRDFYGFYY